VIALKTSGYQPRLQNVSIGITFLGYAVDLVPGERQNWLYNDHSLYKRSGDTWTKTDVSQHIEKVKASGRQAEIRLTKPRFFRGAKSPRLRRGPKPRGGTVLRRGRTERYAGLVRDVVNTHPDLILAVGGRLSLDFKMATKTIPIVTMIVDPIGLGLVASIARPGGNITSVAIAAELEIIGKRMGLLVEAMPKLSTVGYLASRPFWKDPRGTATRETAKQAGISLSPVMLAERFDEAEYQRVFRSMEQDRADAFMVSDEPENSTNRETIVELAAKGRIPAIYSPTSSIRFLKVPIREIFRFTNRLRAGHQSQDRESARPRNASDAARPRR
jgi:hypothetical protein